MQRNILMCERIFGRKHEMGTRHLTCSYSDNTKRKHSESAGTVTSYSRTKLPGGSLLTTHQTTQKKGKNLSDI